MDADYDIFEIVSVFRDFWLVDAESYQRKYRTCHGQPLMAGYYVVNWPDQVRARRFDEQAAFHGPFKSRQEAQSALDWMSQERERAVAMTNGISNSAITESDAAADKHEAPQQASPKSTPAAPGNWGWSGWKPWISGFPPPPVMKKSVKMAA